jgi:universal stress protein A
MTTYRHILLATDCADGSGSACRHTATLAGNLGAEVSLLKVLEHLPQDVPNEPVPPEDVDKIEWFTRRALEELQQYAESSGIPAGRANVVVTTDSPEEEIIRFIRSNDVDLLVVGAHERHGLALFQGRTADNLIHNAPCDVLVVHL